MIAMLRQRSPFGDKRLGAGFVVLLSIDHAEGKHAIEHVVSASDRALRITIRPKAIR
jgi:hypothetical protein